MLFKNIDIQRLWKRKEWYNYLLIPISYIWFILSFFRKIIHKRYISSAFVVCLGNINLGGSGKTPTAIYLGKRLQELGFKIVFLSKGYKGTYDKIERVQEDSDPKIVGDEALLLVKYAPTVVARNFVLGLKYLEKENFDIIIMDDGYQNPRFYKDMSILIVNGDYGFGNELLFPSGPLRQNISSGFKEADHLILLENKNEKIYKLASKYKVEVSEGMYYPKHVESYLNKNFLAFCGIGIPDKFKKTLLLNKLNIVNFLVYPDHYMYSDKDIVDLITKAKRDNLSLITTEKDYIKISKKFRDDVICFSVYLKLDEDILVKKILREYECKK